MAIEIEPQEFNGLTIYECTGKEESWHNILDSIHDNLYDLEYVDPLSFEEVLPDHIKMVYGAALVLLLLEFCWINIDQNCMILK